MEYRKLAGFTDEAADSIESQVRVLHELGWSSMEIRTVDKKQLTDLTDEEFAHVKETLEEGKIHIASVGSNVANWGQSILAPFEDTKTLVNALVPRAKALGAEFVRIMSYRILTDDQGRVLEDQKEEERFRRLRWVTGTLLDNGLVPVHENCFTYGGLSYEHTLRLVEKVPGMKLVFDTGNPPIDVDVRTPFPYSYQDSYEFWRNVKEFISHIHIKDSYVEDGKEIYTFPGEGHGDVMKIVTEALSEGYEGYFSMEPHMEVVFHDASVKADDGARFRNFVEYGRRFESMLRNI